MSWRMIRSWPSGSDSKMNDASHASVSSKRGFTFNWENMLKFAAQIGTQGWNLYSRSVSKCQYLWAACMEPFKDYHIKMRSHMAHGATSLLPYGLGIISAVMPADGIGLVLLFTKG